MHPTTSQALVADRHRAFRADSDRARLVSLARAADRQADSSARPAGHRTTRPSLVQRLVDRLATA